MMELFFQELDLPQAWRDLPGLNFEALIYRVLGDRHCSSWGMVTCYDEEICLVHRFLCFLDREETVRADFPGNIKFCCYHYYTTMNGFA